MTAKFVPLDAWHKPLFSFFEEYGGRHVCSGRIACAFLPVFYGISRSEADYSNELHEKGLQSIQSSRKKLFNAPHGAIVITLKPIVSFALHGLHYPIKVKGLILFNLLFILYVVHTPECEDRLSVKESSRYFFPAKTV